MDALELCIRGGTCVTPAGIVTADVGVAGGRIAALGDLASVPAAEVFDARGLHVLPGIIDTQVHFREPGLTHKEDLETGTRGAVLGGVTTIFEMPNTKPLTLSAADLVDKLARAHGRAWCDYAFFVGGSSTNWRELPHLELLPGCAGVKVFMGSSTGDLMVEDDETLEHILTHGRRRMAVHAEDEPRLRERKSLAKQVADHPHWRDVETAVKAVRRLLRLARAAHRKVHVLHVTSAEELELLAEHKDLASVEITPHHLTMTAPDCYERLGTRAQMNPPVREARHREALWRAVADGVVDILGSDHAPHTLEEKAKPYPQSPSGMTGVQTLVPIMLDHVNAGRLSLERFVDLACAGPARLFDIPRKGRLARGYDADLAIVDLRREVTIERSWIASRAGWSPYEGVRVRGWPVATLLRGAFAMRDGAVVGSQRGASVIF